MRYFAVILALVVLAALAGCGSTVAQNPSTTGSTGPSSTAASSEAATTSQSTATTGQATTTAVSSGQAASNVWTNLSPRGTLPSVRAGHLMVYDSATRRVIMFGGFDESASDGYLPLNDTWAYDPSANTWTNLTPPDAAVRALGPVDGLRPGHPR